MKAFYLLSVVFYMITGDAKSPEQIHKVRQEKIKKLEMLRAEYAELKARYRTAPRPGDVLRKDRLQEEIDKLSKELC